MKDALFSKSTEFQSNLREKIGEIILTISAAVKGDPELYKRYGLWNKICYRDSIEQSSFSHDVKKRCMDEDLIYRFAAEIVLALTARISFLITTDFVQKSDINDLNSLIIWFEKAKKEPFHFLFSEDIFNIWTHKFNTKIQEAINIRLIGFIPVIHGLIDNLNPIEIYPFIHQEFLGLKSRKHFGEVYTPREVSQIINGLLLKSNQQIGNVLDLSCGSGTLLINFAKDLHEKSNKHTEMVNIVGFDLNPIAILLSKCALCSYQIFLGRKLQYLIEPSIFYTDSLITYAIMNEDNQTSSESSNSNQTIDRFINKAAKKGNSSCKLSVEYLLEIYEVEILDSQILGLLSQIKTGDYSAISTLRSEIAKMFGGNRKGPPKKIIVPEKLSTLLSNDMLGEFKQNLFIDKICASFILKGRFDVILGNPPYSRIQSITPLWRRGLYKRSFQAAKGHFDIYYLFFELGIRLLSDQGQLGYVTSNKFMYTKSGKILRKIILGESTITHLIDFNDSHIFDALVLPSIIILSKTADNDEIEYISLRKDVKKPQNGYYKISKQHLITILKNNEEINSGIYQLNESTLINLEHYNSKLPSTWKNSWTFVNNELIEVIREIERNASSNLGKISKKIIVGMKTTANYAFIDDYDDSFVNSPDILKLRRNIKEKYGSDLFFPVIQGAMIRNYRINSLNQEGNPVKYVFYPHYKKDGRICEIPADDIQPMISYLEQNGYDIKMKKRAYLKNAGRKWYEIWNTKDPDDMTTSPKIVVPDISTKNNFAIDYDGYFIDGSAYFILLKNQNIRDYRYILGILNSSVAEFYHKLTSGNTLYAKRYRYWSTTIKKIPIPDIYNQSTKTLDHLTNLVEKVESVNNPTFNRELDDLIFQIYKLTIKSRKIISEWLKKTA